MSNRIVVGAVVVGVAVVVLLVALRWWSNDELPAANVAATPAAGDSPVNAAPSGDETAAAKTPFRVAPEPASVQAFNFGSGYNAAGQFGSASRYTSGGVRSGSIAGYGSGSYAAGGSYARGGSYSAGSSLPYSVATGKIYPGSVSGLMPFGSAAGGGGGYVPSRPSSGSASWNGYSQYPSRSTPDTPPSNGSPLDRKLSELEARAAALEQSIQQLLPLVTK